MHVQFAGSDGYRYRHWELRAATPRVVGLFRVQYGPGVPTRSSYPVRYGPHPVSALSAIHLLTYCCHETRCAPSESLRVGPPAARRQRPRPTPCPARPSTAPQAARDRLWTRKVSALEKLYIAFEKHSSSSYKH